MRPSTSSYIVELPLRVNDQQNRFLEKAFEFGRTLYNATLGTALGRLQRMRETQEWRVARDMPKGKARTKAFSAVHKAFGLTEFGLTIIANNHRKASGRKDIGAHEAQSIGKAVWRGYSVTCSRKPADLASNPSGVDSIPSKARTIGKSCTSPSVEPLSGASTSCRT